ncbi:hypothetical protein ASZ78_002566, partial [Callipepla squamata]
STSHTPPFNNSLPKAKLFCNVTHNDDKYVVYVGTVNPQHLPDTLMFLRARKAVLVEKPMGVSACEAKEMAAAAREAGVFLMESPTVPPSPL